MEYKQKKCEIKLFQMKKLNHIEGEWQRGQVTFWYSILKT